MKLIPLFGACCLACAICLALPLSTCCQPKRKVDLSHGQAYFEVSDLLQKGFARKPNKLKAMEGTVLALQGFVDVGNIEEDSKPGKWRIKVKSRPGDGTGHSFEVIVPRYPGYKAHIQSILKNDRNNIPTRVFVRGRLELFDAPMNFSTRTGIVIHVQDPHSLRFAPSK